MNTNKLLILTPAQHEMFSYLEAFWSEHQRSPTLSEIANNFGTSITNISMRLRRLESAGYLIRGGKGESKDPFSFRPDLSRMPLTDAQLQWCADHPAIIRQVIQRAEQRKREREESQS